MKGVAMDIIIQTFPLQGKTLYYVQCPVCKKDRILNSTSNVSNTVSHEAFRKLCGCTCKIERPAKKKAERKGKMLTAVINGKEMTVREIAEAYGLSTSTVRQRINAGKTEEEIIAPTKRNTKKSVH
jgi:DNA invertase Pin-like site-specific DNA recombinase